MMESNESKEKISPEESNEYTFEQTLEKINLLESRPGWDSLDRVSKEV